MQQSLNLSWNTWVIWTITIKHQIHHLVPVYHTQHHTHLNNDVLQSRHGIVLTIVVRSQESHFLFSCLMNYLREVFHVNSAVATQGAI